VGKKQGILGQQNFHAYHGVMGHAILSHQVVMPRPVALGMDVSQGLMIAMIQ